LKPPTTFGSYGALIEVEPVLRVEETRNATFIRISNLFGRNYNPYRGQCAFDTHEIKMVGAENFEVTRLSLKRSLWSAWSL
jgi:hypothetical protein